MTTVAASNVHNIAIEGTFDDCQDIVKALFADEAFRREQNLSAVNSINWARVMAQIVYYVSTSMALNQRLGTPLDAPVSFCVPTGNFGNIFAAYGAMRMGLAVDELIIASNRNDILTRFFTTGEMTAHAVEPSLSPSMDIQVSSNLERLLFEMFQRNGSDVAELQMQFRAEGTASVDPARLGWLSERFAAGRMSDEECLAEMAEQYRRTGMLLDPHSAVGVGVARRVRGDRERPVICMGTAHPAKFPDAVEAATGVYPALPEHLADLFDRPERFDTMIASTDAVRDYVRSHITAH
jgi:threonine synthase